MSTTELIDQIKDGDNVKAGKTFDNLMKSKLNDALDAKKIEIASTLGRSEEEQEVSVEEPNDE
tara:strand:+ start:253 stop:441 length:189 start_codon:yes stop_codon:yes gene_type:complete